MQEGRDHENESPESDSAPSPPGKPVPSAGPGLPEGTPGDSWVPFSMTSPQDPPSDPAPGGGQAPGGGPAEVEGQPTGPGAAMPPPGGEPWRGQPGYPHPNSGFGQPGYAQPTYGPPGYTQPGYSQPGYGPPPGYGPGGAPPGYGPGGPPPGEPSSPWQAQSGTPPGEPSSPWQAQSGTPPGEPSSPWQAQPGTQPIWTGPGQQQGWNPPPAGGPPYGSQPQPGGAWPPYPADLPGAAPHTGTAPWPPGGGYGPPPPPPSRGPGSRALVYLLVAVLAAAVGAGAVFALRGHPGNSPGVSPQDIPKPRTHVSGSGTPGLNVNAIANKVEPGMVDIVSRLKLSEQVFEGTGMVLSSNGLVLTNNHVIDGSTGSALRAILVTNGHASYPAQIVGWDASQDVALLKLVGASGLKTVQVGNSNTVKIGDQVVALGNAGGQGGTPTVTSGSITDLNRSITASDSGSDTSETLHGMLQSNAPIAPGDSGGPLVNRDGQVVGMDTAANTQNLGAGNNQSYSIPINRALSLVRLMAAGHGSSSVHIGEPPFIGIAIASTSASAISTSTSPQQQLRQLQKAAKPSDGGVNSSGRCLPNDLANPVPSSIAPASTGALVGGVFCNTPASKAGMVGGDVIVAVNGHAVTSAVSLHTVIGNYHPGNTVQVTWIEPNGKKHTGGMTLAAGPVK
jgi:S1-C subfamily serine protease